MMWSKSSIINKRHSGSLTSSNAAAAAFNTSGGSDEDLIKLTDSPMFRKNMDRTECGGGGGGGCATGVLIDLSDTVEVPYPKELLRVGEFDDTFGLYSCSSNNRQGGGANVSTTTTETEETKKSSAETEEKMPRDVFSPVPNKIQPKEEKVTPTSSSTPVTPGLSDSDSILDVNNLSAFSVSSNDMEDDAFVETKSAFGSPLKKNLMRQQETTQSQINNNTVKTEEESGSGYKGTSSEKSAANLGRLQRRNSIVEKMQRLNDIINSPSRTPPVSRLNYLITPSRRNLNQQSMGIQAAPSFSAFSSYNNRESVVEFRNNASSAAINNTNTLPLQLPVNPCNNNSSVVQMNQSDDSINVKPYVVVRPNMQVVQPATSPTRSECGKSDTSSIVDDQPDQPSAIKRLSFTSTASSCSSPPSVKTSVFDPIRIKQLPTSFSSMVGVVRPKQEIKKSYQPLKAFAPVAPAAPVITTNANGKRMMCASAPVTRKFMPPEPIIKSPGKSKVQTTPRRNSISSHTPSKSAGRQSFVNVRSSGYGPQPSPSSRNKRVIPPSPNTAASERNLLTPKAAERNVISRSRVLKPHKEDESFKGKAIVLDKEPALPNLASGIRKINFSSAVGKSKENVQPKGESKVPTTRLVYVRK